MLNSTNYKVIGLCDLSKEKLDGYKVENLNWAEISLSKLIFIPDNKIKAEAINKIYIDVKINCVKLVETPYSRKNYDVALLDENGDVVYKDGKVQSCSCCNTFGLLRNQEGTCLSGRKLIVEGIVKEKIMYTGCVKSQSVHMLEVEYPFLTYLNVYAKFTNTTKLEREIIVVDPLDDTKAITIAGYFYNKDDLVEVDLCEEFQVKFCIEDVFAKLLNKEKILNSITLFLSAKPIVIK